MAAESNSELQKANRNRGKSRLESRAYPVQYLADDIAAIDLRSRESTCRLLGKGRRQGTHNRVAVMSHPTLDTKTRLR